MVEEPKCLQIHAKQRQNERTVAKKGKLPSYSGVYTMEREDLKIQPLNALECFAFLIISS